MHKSKHFYLRNNTPTVGRDTFVIKQSNLEKIRARNDKLLHNNSEEFLNCLE